MEDRDILKGDQINSKGYGIIAKLAMQDTNLDIIAKAIYAYFCSFAGGGDSCFPSRSKICHDLKITNNTFSKYIGQLVKCGYITVEQVKVKGKFSHNVYTINSVIAPCIVSPYTVRTDTQNTVYGEVDTNNNSSNNNSSFNNNSSNKGCGQSDMFETFWKAYPRKVNKQGAAKAFKKLKPNDDLFKAIMDGLENHKKSKQWTRDDGQYIPHPTTWLNGRRWEDELESEVNAPKYDDWDGESNPFEKAWW